MVLIQTSPWFSSFTYSPLLLHIFLCTAVHANNYRLCFIFFTRCAFLLQDLTKHFNPKKNSLNRVMHHHKRFPFIKINTLIHIHPLSLRGIHQDILQNLLCLLWNFTPLCKYFIYIAVWKQKLTGIYTFTLSLLCETTHGFETKQATGFLFTSHPPALLCILFLFTSPRQNGFYSAAFHSKMTLHYKPKIFTHIHVCSPGSSSLVFYRCCGPCFLFSPCVFTWHTELQSLGFSHFSSRVQLQYSFNPHTP